MASMNFGLSGSQLMAAQARALVQLLSKMYMRHGRICIQPNSENSQLRGIMNRPISGWYTTEMVMNMAANVTCRARFRLQWNSPR